jgi:hypothetical protein
LVRWGALAGPSGAPERRRRASERNSSRATGGATAGLANFEIARCQHRGDRKREGEGWGWSRG